LHHHQYIIVRTNTHSFDGQDRKDASGQIKYRFVCASGRSSLANTNSISYGSLRSTHNSKNGTCGLKTSDQLTPLSIRGAVREASRSYLLAVYLSVSLSPTPHGHATLSTPLLAERGSKHIDGRWRSSVPRYAASRVLEGCESKY